MRFLTFVLLSTLFALQAPAGEDGRSEGIDACAFTEGFHHRGVGSGGFQEDVLAIAVYDDGDGPALYVAGRFQTAGPVVANHVAKWDGTAWSPLGSGTDDEIHALAVYDDGSGPALVAAGDFTTAGGLEANRVASWDGSEWTPLAGGFDDEVHALEVYDDGGGDELFAGGAFEESDGLAVPHLARWDGTRWTAPGSGTDAAVFALRVYDDGGGARLVAGGSFTEAGAQAVDRVASWDGTTWSPLGSGVAYQNSGAVPFVRALEVYDDGGGEALVAGGGFDTAGGIPSGNIARWDGTTWSALGSGTADTVRDLEVYDGGTALAVAGDFQVAGGVPASYAARWDGTTWSALAGLEGSTRSLNVYDFGSGSQLVAGGVFDKIDGDPAHHLARWDGMEWQPFPDATPGRGFGRELEVLHAYDSVFGPILIAGGRFGTAGETSVDYIAGWDDDDWASLGAEMNGSVFALETADLGSGPLLFAGGAFTRVQGETATHIAQWDGTGNWSPVGPGINNAVYALAAYDDGSGPKLVAGGLFTAIDGETVRRIAQWDGASWSSLGFGLGTRSVYALEVYDAPGGPVLVAAGDFEAAGGNPANHIAQWDGTAWSPLGSGTDDDVLALAQFDDGSGPKLIAGGVFQTAGGVASPGIAQWDGTAWSPLGAGLDAGSRVTALRSYDAARGPRLVAAGEFTSSGTTPLRNIARWDGTAWKGVGSGIGETVRTLELFPHEGEVRPWVGGSFFEAGGRASLSVGVFHCALPRLRIPAEIPGTFGLPVEVPVEFETDGSTALGGVGFSLDLDTSCLSFDPADADNDGVPDAVTYQGPGSYSFFVTFDETDTDGELDVALVADGDAPEALSDGTLFTLEVTPACEDQTSAAVSFSDAPAPTFSDLEARDVSGSWSGGSVSFAGPLFFDDFESGDLKKWSVTSSQ